MKYTKYASGVVITATLAVAAIAIPLSNSFADAATGNSTAQIGGGWNGENSRLQQGPMMGVRPAVVGSVSAINGNSLTVTQRSHAGFGFGSSTITTTPTTFTVDATNATIFKNNATSTVSNIVVGDTVVVQGTVNGTNVTATTIRDGIIPMMNGAGRMHEGMGIGSTTYQGEPGDSHRGFGSSTGSTTVNNVAPITGNGQPVIAGNISAINGTSLIITNKSNITYTVEASNAKIVEGQNTITVSSLSVGDNVIVQGSVNGTSVTASSVIDEKAPINNGNASSTGPRGGPQGRGGGIFGAIGGFFSHMFGF